MWRTLPQREKFLKNWSEKRQMKWWKFVLRGGVSLGLVCGLGLSIFILIDPYNISMSNFLLRVLKITVLSTFVFSMFYVVVWFNHEKMYQEYSKNLKSKRLFPLDVIWIVLFIAMQVFVWFGLISK